MELLEMVPVRSSALEAVGYDPATSQLRIQFTSGRVYDFFQVPEQVYAELMHAPSKGSYFNYHIRNTYAR